MLLYVFLIALIAIPWYVAVHVATNGEFTREFFFRHNLNRFGEPMEGHGGIFLLIPMMVFIGLLPVSVFSVEAGKKFRSIRKNALTQLSLYAVIAFIVFFSISGTKLPNYPMPCYPFMAVLLGYWIDKAITGQVRVKQYPFWLLLLLNSLLLAAAWIGLGLETATQSFRYWALLLALPVITAAGFWWYFKKTGLQKAMWILLAGYSVFNFLFLAVGYPAIYQHNPVTKTLHLLKKEEQVYAYKIYNPAYNFYLDRSVQVLDDAAQVKQVLSAHPNAIIISRENHLPELDPVPVRLIARERDLFETATTVLVGRK
jgi:4-amino-4-deoxy-L-arabinose transferase-like glycosyltransferase